MCNNKDCCCCCPSKNDSIIEANSGLRQYLLGIASHFQTSLCLKIAKKCSHNRPMWLKSGQVHLGIEVFPTKDALNHLSLESGDLT